jgi:hypothetical protein
MFKGKSKQPKKQGIAIWVDDVGGISTRVFEVLKQEKGKVTIGFGKGENYVIKKDNIRARKCLIWKKADGEIMVQNPNNWKKIDLKKHKIKELRFNLQNFSIQEGRASIHRWTMPPNKIMQLAPLFKLLMVCIAIGVMGWAALKFTTYVLDTVMHARLLDCATVLPKAQIPIGAITNPINATNITAPIGA